MPCVNHVNIADAAGQVYCCLRNRVVKLSEDHHQTYCASCKMFNGNALGLGVECFWDDALALQEEVLVEHPYREWLAQQAKHSTLPLPVAIPQQRKARYG